MPWYESLCLSNLEFIDLPGSVMFFIKCGQFSATISSGKFFVPIGDSDYTSLVHLILHHRSLKLCIFSQSFFTFLYVLQIVYFLLTYIQIYWCFLVSYHICCWTCLMNFSFQLLNFAAQESPFGSLLWFLFLYWYSLFVV